MPLPPSTQTRLEKAALDCGFDLELPRQGDWLGYGSTRAPLRVWLSAVGKGLFLLALSQHKVARALPPGDSAPLSAPLPDGAVAVRALPDLASLHRLLRRAVQLSRTLPDELLHAFAEKTQDLPRATEVERLVIQRVGQDLFRAGLLEFWEGRCALTGLPIPDLLRSSHIKPWADCDNDAERLDIWNGLLLAAHVDAAFDRGFITFQDDGGITLSPHLPDTAQRILGLHPAQRIPNLTDGHRKYLPWHRTHVFRGGT